jgi:TetR/AcrR family transcriptional repressor of nem operon
MMIDIYMYSDRTNVDLEWNGSDMKVTKAQAQENRSRIVRTASSLFRERGYDGVGLAELMSASGFTHGGFYNHFGSKADLIAESCALSLSETAAQAKGLDAATFVKLYLSRKHRDARGEGCTMAALGSDTARQSDEIKATFAAGIESLLAALDGESAGSATRAKLIDTFARSVGAIVLSRACPDDSALADEILAVCLEAALAALATPAASKRSRKPK